DTTVQPVRSTPSIDSNDGFGSENNNFSGSDSDSRRDSFKHTLRSDPGDTVALPREARVALTPRRLSLVSRPGGSITESIELAWQKFDALLMFLASERYQSGKLPKQTTRSDGISTAVHQEPRLSVNTT